jgi:hypothetical protein
MEKYNKLDTIQKHLENDLFFIDIDAEDLHHEEKDIIVRAFTFSQGQREEVMVIGDDCHIYYHNHMTDKDIEPNLTKEVCSSLLSLVLENEEI